MFNQYLPPPEAYAPMEPPSRPPTGHREDMGERVRGLLKLLRLDKLDSGDLLLLLVVLLLWREDKDSDLLLAVGGALLLGEET